MSDVDFWFGFIVGVVIISVAILVLGGIASDISSERTVDINKNVKGVVLHRNYMTVTFDDNESYNINMFGSSSSNNNNIIDFDQGAHVLVRLRWSSGWFNPNNDDCWGIVKLVKY
jgi:uncharacterized membrane protein required for colicin V production